MQELNEVKPIPTTELEILREGLAQIARQAPGGHQDSNNPCYGMKREWSDYAQRILDAARACEIEEEGWSLSTIELPLSSLQGAAELAVEFMHGTTDELITVTLTREEATALLVVPSWLEPKRSEHLKAERSARSKLSTALDRNVDKVQYHS